MCGGGYQDLSNKKHYLKKKIKCPNEHDPYVSRLASVTSFIGARNQPLVQLQRKSLQLPADSNYTALSAVLTTARSQYEIGGFPYLLGLETNSTGWLGRKNIYILVI